VSRKRSWVTSIGGRAFEACTSLTSIAVDELNPVFSSADGVLFNKTQSTLRAYPPLLMLRTGNPLIVAGLGRRLGGRSFAIAGAELWNPATGVWTNTGSLIPLAYHCRSI